MERTIKLTPKEYVVCSIMVGADSTFGAVNPWDGCTEEEFWRDVESLLDEMAEKGVGSMDFDGEFSLNKEVENIVKTCAYAERAFCVDMRKNTSGEMHYLLYKKGERVVLRTSAAAGKGCDYALIEKDEAKALLSEAVALCGSGNDLPDGCAARLESSIIERARAGKETDCMIDAGCDARLARLLLQGLLGDASYYSIVSVDLPLSSEPESMILISSEEGTAVLEMNYTLEEELVCVSAVQTRQAQSDVNGLLEKFLFGEVI